MSTPPAVRFPVALCAFTHRQDPANSSIMNYRFTSAFDFASSIDEAVGIGVRLCREKWPPSEGWSTPDVAVSVVRPSEIERAVKCYKEAADSGVMIKETQDGISIAFQKCEEAKP